jgi:hypothetical protein
MTSGWPLLECRTIYLYLYLFFVCPVAIPVVECNFNTELSKACPLNTRANGASEAVYKK